MILDRLADATRARYAQRMTDTPLDIVKSRALALPKGNFAFERALGAPGVSLICEVKKASPSKGLISPDFPGRETGLLRWPRSLRRPECMPALR